MATRSPSAGSGHLSPCYVRSVLVTTSKALVTRSDELVTFVASCSVVMPGAAFSSRPIAPFAEMRLLLDALAMPLSFSWKKDPTEPCMILIQNGY